MAPRPLREDLKNQESPVIDRKLHVPLQISLLTRAECLVKQNFGGTGLLCQLSDFLCFTGTYKQRCIWSAAFAHNTPYRLQTCCLSQKSELFQLRIEIQTTQIDTNQYGQRQFAFLGIIQWEKNSLQEDPKDPLF